MFQKRADGYLGRYPRCKGCVYFWHVEYIEKNADKIREGKKKYVSEHKEELAIKKHMSYEKNKDAIKQQTREWYAENTEYALAYAEEYREGHRVERRAYENERYATDPKFRMIKHARGRMWDLLKSKGKGKVAFFVRDLGCTKGFLFTWIESKFKPGMSWENYGKVWHLDHVRPLVDFNLDDPQDCKKINHYTNLQPLFWRDNLSKGKKLDWKAD